MAGAKQHNDMGLSWFRPWAVRPERVRSGDVLCCTVVLAEGSTMFWLLITCLRFLFVSFLFLCPELATMCVVNALIKGEIEDRSVRGLVDGHSLV
jgi:hypothetical protein